MKRTVAIALIMAMTLALGACGAKEAPAAGTPPSTKETAADSFDKSPEELTTADTEKRGNTVGNITNGGYIAQEGEWIYYLNIIDRKDISGASLCKVKTDGTDYAKINDDAPMFINAYDEWIYYSNVKDGNKLYRVHNDGSQREALTSGAAFYINVVDDWIYYVDDEYEGNLIKMHTNGLDVIQLNQETDSDSGGYNVYWFAICDGWIYFNTGSMHIDGMKDDADVSLYKMRVDGTELLELGDGNAGRLEETSYVNVEDGWIYYVDNYLNVDGHGLDHNGIFKMRDDGNQNLWLPYDWSDIDVQAIRINVLGGWIYYWVFYDDSIHLGRMLTDGSQNEQLYDTNNWMSDTVFVLEEWVYFLTETDAGTAVWGKMRVEGTERQMLVS